MAVSFPRFSWRLWAPGKGKGKEKEPSLELGYGLRDHNKKNKKKKMGNWLKSSREEKEFEFVVVSDSDSESSEISIGWIEPHGPGFRGESDGGFAVLVPCYSPGSKELSGGSTSAVFRAITGNFPTEFSSGMNISLDRY